MYLPFLLRMFLDRLCCRMMLWILSFIVACAGIWILHIFKVSRGGPVSLVSIGHFGVGSVKQRYPFLRPVTEMLLLILKIVLPPTPLRWVVILVIRIGELLFWQPNWIFHLRLVAANEFPVSISLPFVSKQLEVAFVSIVGWDFFNFNAIVVLRQNLC